MGGASLTANRSYLLSDPKVILMPEYWVDHHREHPAGWGFRSHHHSQFEIALVTEGSCTYVTSGSIVKLEKGTAVFVSSNVPHGVWGEKQQGFTLAVLHFPTLPDDLHATLIGATNGIQLSDADQVKYVDICLQIEQELVANLPGVYLLCNALVTQLLVLLLRAGRQSPAGISSSAQKQIVSAALHWLHTHLSEDVQTKDVAAHVSVSSSHLRRLFKMEVGLTLKQYLQNLRIEKSKGMLMDPDISIASVARMSGFTPQQFARVFQACTGLTASEWRNRYSRAASLAAIEDAHTSAVARHDR